LKLSAGSLQYHNRLPLQAINPRKAVLPCSDIILEKKVRQGLNKDRRSMEIPMVRPPRLWSSLILSIVFCLVNGANTALAQSPDQPWMNTRLSPEKRAELVLTQMTLAEKIALLHGNGMQHAPQWQMPLTSISNGGAGYVEGVPRLGIPPLFISDAAYGIRDSGANGRYSTALPSDLAATSSWDPQGACEYGALIGRELRAQGYNMTLGGGVNITREPRNGRTFEYAGEDPLLAGTMVGNLMKC